MIKTKQILDIFAKNYPNSGHPLDEERFKKFVIASFLEGYIYTEDNLLSELLEYKFPNDNSIFSEEQARERVSEYINYIELLNLYTNN
ncbi:MAG: hypothetical protein PHG82_03305 [Candidatus Gracilibacteria bacterium]|nr:hypothetical protein [Candidatus Gracilibacteria bacterium]